MSDDPSKGSDGRLDCLFQVSSLWRADCFPRSRPVFSLFSSRQVLEARAAVSHNDRRRREKLIDAEDMRDGIARVLKELDGYVVSDADTLVVCDLQSDYVHGPLQAREQRAVFAPATPPPLHEHTLFQS